MQTRMNERIEVLEGFLRWLRENAIDNDPSGADEMWADVLDHGVVAMVQFQLDPNATISDGWDFIKTLSTQGWVAVRDQHFGQDMTQLAHDSGVFTHFEDGVPQYATDKEF